MEITKEELEKIEKYLPKPRGNLKVDNLQLINAMLYVMENGWALPKHYGNWHTVYEQLEQKRSIGKSVCRSAN